MTPTAAPELAPAATGNSGPSQDSTEALRELSIHPGRDKSGKPEAFETIVLKPGDLIALVGPTGAGKSRLLADIEWLASGDTPSGRHVRLNGGGVQGTHRHYTGSRLVAQLSQTMTFMVDLPVGPFLSMHAQSRGIVDAQGVIEGVLESANQLAGEPFALHTALSSLSGGQSRALMIADTALLCQSPIVLVDEIENAGIDRRRALNLLLSRDKIVIMATHDPMLALLAERRLVIRNGAITNILDRSAAESTLLAELEATDRRHQSIRDSLRRGQSLA